MLLRSVVCHDKVRFTADDTEHMPTLRCCVAEEAHLSMDASMLCMPITTFMIFTTAYSNSVKK
jgi:hypothetical protein